jgi:hypothetical protein
VLSRRRHGDVHEGVRRAASGTGPLARNAGHLRTKTRENGLAKTCFGEGTVTLVVLTRGKDNKLEVARKIRVSGQADVARWFAMVDGRPVVGRMVFRELSNAELEKLGRPAGFKRTNYFECLVPALPAPGAGTDEKAA